MDRLNGRFFLRMFFLIAGVSASLDSSAQESWLKSFPGLGTFSSPRVADLNGDGIGDIIMGVGRLEFQACDTAIIALNGKNGKLLWKNASPDQIFGSAAIKDLNGDGIMDVIIGGRAAEMRAINGKNGKIIWKFDKNKLPKKAKRWYNFYNRSSFPTRMATEWKT